LRKRVINTLSVSILLLVFVLAIPAMAKNDNTNVSNTTTLTIGNSTITFAPGVDPDTFKNITNFSSNIAKTFSVNLSKYNIFMSKDQFIKENEKFIEFLRQYHGNDATNQIVNEEYIKYIASTTSLTGSTSPSSITTGTELTNSLSTSGNIVQVPYVNGAYLWPYINNAQSTSSDVGPVNLIWLHTNKGIFEYEYLTFNPLWTGANGWTEYGLAGGSPSSLSWYTSYLQADQLELGSYFASRYHVLLFGTIHDSTDNFDWVYGSAHHEYFSVQTNPLCIDHVIYDNGYTQGMQMVMDATKNCPYSWYGTVSLDNPRYLSNGVTFEIWMQ